MPAPADGEGVLSRVVAEGMLLASPAVLERLSLAVARAIVEGLRARTRDGQLEALADLYWAEEWAGPEEADRSVTREHLEALLDGLEASTCEDALVLAVARVIGIGPLRAASSPAPGKARR